MTDPQHNERIHKEPLNSAELGLFRQEREKELAHGKRERSVMTARLDQVSGRGEDDEKTDHDSEGMFYGGSGETMETETDDDPVVPEDTPKADAGDPPPSEDVWVGVAVGTTVGLLLVAIILLLFWRSWARHNKQHPAVKAD